MNAGVIAAVLVALPYGLVCGWAFGPWGLVIALPTSFCWGMFARERWGT